MWCKINRRIQYFYEKYETCGVRVSFFNFIMKKRENLWYILKINTRIIINKYFIKIKNVKILGIHEFVEPTNLKYVKILKI